MALYLLGRLVWMAILLVVVSFITFVIFTQLPSADPVVLRAGRGASPELIEAIRAQLGLDKGFWGQYWTFFTNTFFHFDLGTSYQNKISVKEQIFDRVPATLALSIGGMVVWLLAGIPIGILAALKRGRWPDKLAMGAALVAISAPVYWLGLVSLYLFSKDIGVIGIFEGQGSYPTTGTILSDPIGVGSSLLLPWLVLAASFAAIYARFLRANLSEVMGEDYIRTARAKGLRERRVVFRHGVRSAITPIVTLVGLDLGILLGGAILTESVFNIPGVGRLAFDSIQKSDLPTVQGTVLLGAFFIIALNLVVDIVYAFLDPRVRY